MCSFRDVLNSRQSLAPKAILRQCSYLLADGCCISAAGLYCLRKAAHSRLLITVSKLDVGEEPQQFWSVRPGSEGVFGYHASRGDIPSVEQVPSPQLGAEHWISRDSTSGPAISAYYTHNLSMPESVSPANVKRAR